MLCYINKKISKLQNSKWWHISLADFSILLYLVWFNQFYFSFRRYFKGIIVFFNTYIVVCVEVWKMTHSEGFDCPCGRFYQLVNLYFCCFCYVLVSPTFDLLFSMYVICIGAFQYTSVQLYLEWCLIWRHCEVCSSF